MADLHIHTRHSPCAERSMTAEAIVDRAALLGLDLIAVCDHNTADGVPEVLRAAGRRMAVLAGMEITTAEEVHVVGLFPELEGALEMSRALTGRIPAEHRGIASTGLSLEETVARIHERGGLAVAAHVDRRAFSVISQLGFLPPGIPFDALEISAAGVRRGRAAEHARHGLPLVSSSDAHSLDEMGAGSTTFSVEAPTLDEIALALEGRGGRRVSLA